MKQLSLTWKFLIPIAVIFIVVGAVLSYQVRQLVRQEAIEVVKRLVVDLVETHAQRYVRSPGDFSLGEPQKTEDIFSSILSAIRSRDVIRIKVWAPNGTIIFSDDKSLVGKNFASNEEFQEAMAGDVVAEIGPPVKPEHVSERGYRQLMEIYVPIAVEGERAGVIETYYNMERLNEILRRYQLLVRVTIAASFFVLSLLVWLLFRWLVISPLKKLERGLQEIKG